MYATSRRVLQLSQDRSRGLRRQRAEPPAQVSLGAQHFKTSATTSQRHATARAATKEPHMSRDEGFRSVAWRERPFMHPHTVLSKTA